MSLSRKFMRYLEKENRSARNRSYLIFLNIFITYLKCVYLVTANFSISRNTNTIQATQNNDHFPESISAPLPVTRER